MRHELTTVSVTLSRDGQTIGAVADETAALVAALDDADTLKIDAEYEIRKTVKFIVKRQIVGPDAPALGPVLTISSSALTVTLDRAASGPTRIDRYELEQLTGSTWNQIALGIGIFSSDGEFPVTNLLSSTLYQFRCRAVDTTERASEYSYSAGVTAAGPTNQVPVWTSPVNISLNPGESISIAQYCVDPEGTSVVFSKVSSSPATTKVTVSGSGMVSAAADCPANIYALTVKGSDGLLSANGLVTLTVEAQSLETPVNFTATGNGATTINLSWAASPIGLGPDDYDLDFSATSATGPWTSIPIGYVTSYAHTGRTADVTYYYRLRANLGAVSSGYATTSGEIPIVIPPSGTPTTDTIYTGSWRGTEDTVQGWDWTLPSGVAATNGCGVYTMNDSPYPSGWTGNKIKDIDVHWHALEPSIGSYNFSSITSQLNDLSYDGVVLNVRGFVVAFPNQPQEVSAPAWATGSSYPTYTTSGNVGAITSLLAFNANVKAKWLALITALGNAGILTSTRLWGAIIHMPAASRGEEYNTDQGNSAASTAVAIEYIKAWAAASGANKKYLMWTNDRGGTSVNPAWGTICDAALAEGVGARGGAIESWLWNLYTPGAAKYTYQTITNGYLGVNEDGVTIAEGRGWLDENEAYRNASDATNPIVQQNYRMANLRMLQMRRRLMWVVGNYKMNPAMDKWLSLEAGKTAATSPDAWCCLMQTWGAPSASPLEIKNFERWLYQRDDQGATTPTTKKNHGKNVTLVDGFPTASLYINLARQGTSIGIAVDDDFIAAGASDSVCIKVVFLDSGTNTWTLQYTKTNGTTATKSETCTDTNIVRTASFFITDFKNPASGLNADFYLKSSNASVPFMFVRVIKV